MGAVLAIALFVGIFGAILIRPKVLSLVGSEINEELSMSKFLSSV